MIDSLHNLDRLIAFVNVVESGSETKAAQHLFLTQSGISRQIRLMEDELGLRLLERGHSGVAPTEAGRILYGYAKKLASLMEELSVSLSELREGTSGSINIGAVMTVGKYLLPPLFSQFKTQYPGSQISLRVANAESICQMVLSGEIQLGLTASIAPSDELSSEAFCKDQVVLVAWPGHPLASHSAVSAEDLANYDFVEPPTGSMSSKRVTEILSRLGICPHTVMRMEAPEVIKTAVQSSAGLAFLWRLSVAQELKARTLCEIKVKGLELWDNYSIVSKTGAHRSQILQLFVDFLREEAPVVVSAARS